ncbi:unnamed protein product, partial [Didymodactylos carnosus]
THEIIQLNVALKQNGIEQLQKYVDNELINPESINYDKIKLAASSLTVVVSSGDGGTSNVAFTNNDISGADPTCALFLPIYLSYSHYAVSVGAPLQTRNLSAFNDILYGTSKDGVRKVHSEPFAERCPTRFHVAVGWNAVSG